MVNNEQTKIQNAKDLKFYRFMVAMAFVVAIVIALIVGIATVDSYKTQANLTNAFFDVVMPKSIEGQESTDTKGLTFYREKNNDYDANNNQPLDAFKYYIKGEDGKKIYLKDGKYYPPEYYMENSTAEPILVNLAFYCAFLQNLQVVKNVLVSIIAVFGLFLAFGIIYIWYRSWCKREDARIARTEEYNKRFSKNK